MSSFPKIKTIQTWLNISPSEGMKGKLCVKWEKMKSLVRNTCMHSLKILRTIKDLLCLIMNEHRNMKRAKEDLQEKEKCETSGLP